MDAPTISTSRTTRTTKRTIIRIVGQMIGAIHPRASSGANRWTAQRAAKDGGTTAAETATDWSGPKAVHVGGVHQGHKGSILRAGVLPNEGHSDAEVVALLVGALQRIVSDGWVEAA